MPAGGSPYTSAPPSAAAHGKNVARDGRPPGCRPAKPRPELGILRFEGGDTGLEWAETRGVPLGTLLQPVIRVALLHHVGLAQLLRGEVTTEEGVTNAVIGNRAIGAAMDFYTCEEFHFVHP